MQREQQNRSQLDASSAHSIAPGWNWPLWWQESTGKNFGCFFFHSFGFALLVCCCPQLSGEWRKTNLVHDALMARGREAGLEITLLEASVTCSRHYGGRGYLEADYSTTVVPSSFWGPKKVFLKQVLVNGSQIYWKKRNRTGRSYIFIQSALPSAVLDTGSDFIELHLFSAKSSCQQWCLPYEWL
jgi:hypothetical protein